MNSIIKDYITYIIKPLEEFKNKLLTKYHFSYNDELIQRIDNDLFERYQKLSDLLDNYI